MKMKTVLPYSLMLCALVLFCACGDSSKYADIIPANASTVVKLNVSQMLKKADVGDADQKFVTDKLKTEIDQQYPASLAEQLKKIVDNPSTSGIDFSEPMYLYNVVSDSISVQGLVFKMDSKDDMTAVVKSFMDANKKGQFVEGDTCNRYSFEGYEIVYNENSLLVAKMENCDPTIVQTSLYNQFLATKDNSFRSQMGYESMEKQETDIAIYVSMADVNMLRLANYSPMNMVTKILPDGLPLETFYINATLNFGDGELTATAGMSSTDPEMQKKLDAALEKKETIEGDLVQYIPSDALMCLVLNLQGGNVAKQFHQVIAKIGLLQNSQLVALKQFLENIDGDVVFSALQVNVEKASESNIALLAKVKSIDPVNNLAKNLEGFSDLGNNKYMFDFSNVTYYYGATNQVMYVTNDSDISSLIPASKPVDVSLAKGKLFYLSLNNKELFHTIAPKMDDLSKKPVAKKFVADMDCLVFFVNKDGIAEAKMSLTDTSDNILKTFVAMVKELSSHE
ncbi:MAG: DUF4836 family protein [Bacteroidaceae bacterium]